MNEKLESLYSCVDCHFIRTLFRLEINCGFNHYAKGQSFPTEVVQFVLHFGYEHEQKKNGTRNLNLGHNLHRIITNNPRPAKF